MLAELKSNINKYNKLTCKSNEAFEYACLADDYYSTYFIILCLGGALSFVGFTASVCMWALFRETRNFQNYISLNQCFAATALCVITCINYSGPYFFAHDVHRAIKTGDIKVYVAVIEEYSSRKSPLIPWIVPTATYLFLSLYCWSMTAAVVCYIRIVKVFASDVPRKYLIVSLVCYGAPFPFLVFHDGVSLFLQGKDKDIISVTILAAIISLTIVNACLYMCVIVAICKGKRPGHGETIRTLTTGIVIFIIFGLSFCVVHVIIMSATLTRGEDSLEYIKTLNVHHIIRSLLLSIHPIVISGLHVIGRSKNRKLWLKSFSKESDDTGM